MLFIFQTSAPQRHFLHIDIKTKFTIQFQNHVINLHLLKEALSSTSIDLPKGSLHQLCLIEDILVLIWDFAEFTMCSKASQLDFGFVDTRLFKVQNEDIKVNVGLHFFTLGAELCKILWFLSYF